MSDETRVNPFARLYLCWLCYFSSLMSLLIGPTMRPTETEQLTMLVKLFHSATVKNRRWDGTICHSRCRIGLRITQRRDEGDKKT